MNYVQEDVETRSTQASRLFPAVKGSDSPGFIALRIMKELIKTVYEYEESGASLKTGSA